MEPIPTNGSTKNKGLPFIAVALFFNQMAVKAWIALAAPLIP